MSDQVLVIAPHPDDEVLGVGGTILKRVAGGDQVCVLIATTAGPPRFEPEVLATGRREAAAAHRVLGVDDSRFLPFPAAGLGECSHAELNAALIEVFVDVRPDVVFVPFNGDLHLDHQRIFLSALVAARPSTGFTPRLIYAYETLSETNWNAPYLTPPFVPNVYVDISEHLETKLAAMAAYASQLKAPPHERSIEALRALATLRGATVGYAAAEAFVLVRELR
jgi:LmbE family N-acetylglucosaminyl deacetylase